MRWIRNEGLREGVSLQSAQEKDERYWKVLMYMWSHIKNYQCIRSQLSSLFRFFTVFNDSFDHWYDYLIDLDDLLFLEFFNLRFDLHNLFFHTFSLDVMVVKFNDSIEDSSWNIQDMI